MSFAGRLSELLSRPREPRTGFPWTFYRLLSPGLTTLEIALAAAIVVNMMAEGGTINPDTARAITAIIENWDRFKLLPNPAEALAIVLLIHRGGNGLMSIIEKVIQPLLNAQREIGHVQGHAEGHVQGHAEGRTEALAESNTEWRKWLERKARAESEGRTFEEPPPDEMNQ